MNKLTAERCLERIDKLKTSQRLFGISMLEEDYLEALEIALPVLEQQEKGNDGWIEWGGGECPVSAVEVVEYRTVFGNVCKNVAAMTRWEHLGLMGDIIAYRVVEQERERGEEV